MTSETSSCGTGDKTLYDTWQLIRVNVSDRTYTQDCFLLPSC